MIDKLPLISTRSAAANPGCRRGPRESVALGRAGGTVLSKGRLIAPFILLAVTPVNADGPVAQHTVHVRISPECKDGFYGPDVKGNKLRAIKPLPDYVAWNPADAQPRSFKDPRTLVTLYVESDGRHLAAIDSNGALLWVRNPFEDAALCPYRTPRPVISKITVPDVRPDYMKALHLDPAHRFVEISFDSSQFGLVDETTGEFYFGGNN